MSASPRIPATGGGDALFAEMVPYAGVHNPGVDCGTLAGKVMCGYLHHKGRPVVAVWGAGMLYVAMFDEVDEGTAIFKCANEPPVGESRFVTYEGLPSDHYLWLTGRIREVLQDRASASVEMPERRPAAGPKSPDGSKQETRFQVSGVRLEPVVQPLLKPDTRHPVSQPSTTP